MVPRGSPLPALGSPRNVMPVMLCEKRQQRTGGNARAESHVISFVCPDTPNHHQSARRPTLIFTAVSPCSEKFDHKLMQNELTGRLSVLHGGGGGFAQSLYNMRIC